MKKAFAQRLTQRVDELRVALREAERSKTPAAWEEVKRLAHRLAGTAGSYGYHAESEAAGALDRALTRRETGVASDDEVARAAALLNELPS